MKKNKLVLMAAVLSVCLLFSSCGSILAVVTKSVLKEKESVEIAPVEPEETTPAEEPEKPDVEEIPETPEADKYTDYMMRASEIEKYSATYLERAVSQNDLNAESYNVYMMWDGLLNEVYQYLKQIMPESDFASLQIDEVEWIEKKEAAMAEASAEWEGGSGEPMARYGVGITYTRERCYYLIGMLE